MTLFSSPLCEGENDWKKKKIMTHTHHIIGVGWAHDLGGMRSAQELRRLPVLVVLEAALALQ